jgi:uncharacterized protein YcfL
MRKLVLAGAALAMLSGCSSSQGNYAGTALLSAGISAVTPLFSQVTQSVMQERNRPPAYGYQQPYGYQPQGYGYAPQPYAPAGGVQRYW